MSESIYQALVDSVFGTGQCKVSGKVSNDNRPLAYINANRADTKPFADNFVERLVRLKSIYSNDEHSMNHIRKLAADVGAQDGQGAYAELGALDFIGRMYKTVMGTPALLNQDLPATSTFAGPTRKKANVDGLIQEWNTYFDVRLFRNPFDDILGPIINELEIRFGASIFPEPEGSYDYTILQADNRIPAIKAELEEALKARETFLRVRCAPKLDFRIGWGSNFAQRHFDPYERAFIDHKSVFNKADQFVRTGPFILFLVVPPWEYGNILWVRDLDLTCYRALCRRVFCQYIGRIEICDKHQHTYDEVSRAISMIIILNLHDTLNRMEEIMIARAYANPNANHPFPSRMRQFLSEQKIPLDDFEWDNY